MPSACALLHNSLDERRAYPAAAVLWSDEHAGKPRCQRRANVHVTRDKSHRTIFHGLAGTEMAPLRVMPASHNGYELMTISKIFDGHT